MFCTAVILPTSFTSSWVSTFCGVCENKCCSKLPYWDFGLTVQQLYSTVNHFHITRFGTGYIYVTAFHVGESCQEQLKWT